MHRPALRLLAAALIVAGTFSANAQGTRTRHVRDEIRTGEARVNGHLPDTQVLALDLVLPLRDPAGLDAFLADVYNPGSANFRQFVTPAAFTARFGPTQAQYDATVNFARANGLTVTGGSRDGMDVQVRGTVSAIESAFRIRINTYQHPRENRTAYGTDREPVTGLPFDLWHISGLDNFSIPHPLLVNRNDYAAAHHLSAEGVVSHATTGSGPSASFLGSDMRAAYYGGTLNGAGQNLGLLEYYGTDLDDLTTYYSNIGQTNSVPVQLLSVDGTSTTCLKRSGCDDTEQELDITQALGMAPGLSSLVMYVGSSDTAIMSAMTTHSPLPMTIGCSWGWTPVDPTALDPYFQKMAAQGQTFFAASGDSSTWSMRNQAWPADDPYVVSVGGTDLITTGAGGAWQSETAWLDSGGGITTNGFAIPTWQQSAINAANRGSVTLRNGPDVSANANFTFYTCSNQTTCLANSYGGTSFAAPMWAGYVALANQQLATNGQAPAGFINPVIYQQNGDASAYLANFHDVTSGTSGSYAAVSGFDLVTGWGSPTSGLITALAGTGSTQTPAFTLGASPSTVTVTAGGSGSSTVTTAVSGGFNSDVSLSFSGVPSGVTAGFSPASIAAPGAGSSVLTFNVAAGTAAGSYPITVTATGGGLTQTTTITLTVNATVQTADFAIVASPSSMTLARGTSGSSLITVTPSGSFNSAVNLTATGGGAGLSISVQPSGIAAPGQGSSSLQLTASRNAVPGVHTIKVTATGGGVTNSTTVTVTVTR